MRQDKTQYRSPLPFSPRRMRPKSLRKRIKDSPSRSNKQLNFNDKNI